MRELTVLAIGWTTGAGCTLAALAVVVAVVAALGRNARKGT